LTPTPQRRLPRTEPGKPQNRSQPSGRRSYLATTDDQGRAIRAIGDVAGHGLEAATAMAQLRYALTGWIATGITAPSDLTANLKEQNGEDSIRRDL
jgi:hypothetical protein